MLQNGKDLVQVPQGPIKVPLQKSCHQSCLVGDIITLFSLIKDLTEKEKAYTLNHQKESAS